LIWFSALLAVLEGWGSIPPKIALNHDQGLMFFFFDREIAQQFVVQDSFA